MGDVPVLHLIYLKVVPGSTFILHTCAMPDHVGFHRGMLRHFPVLLKGCPAMEGSLSNRKIKNPR